MHYRHVIRGGLFVMGVGIGTICLTASAGAGTHGATTALAAGRAAVPVVVPDAAWSVASVPEAPAATPVLIEIPVVEPPVEEAQPAAEPVSEEPVVQAGSGPVEPVPGAVTLIDPLVIERAPDDSGT